MDIFFDTPVLVAAFINSHPHHTQAQAALRRVVSGRARGYMATQSIAEVYAALTHLPLQPPIDGQEAERIINENILPHFTVMSVGRGESLEVLSRAAHNGWRGTQIYDALLLHCAEHCRVDRIYSFNVTELRQLAPAELQAKIVAPGAAAYHE